MKPPPIFVYVVVNVASVITKIRGVFEDEQCARKSMANDTIKNNTKTPDSYRKLTHSVKSNDIKREIEELG